MDVSIIIVTYNTYKMTSECIDSIFKQQCPLKYEVILVDNSSVDESKVNFSKDSRIKYIYSEENLGFGKANNLGYSLASGKYILFLNSDTILNNDAISMFYNIAENSASNIVCWGTTLSDKDGRYIHSFGKFPTLWSYIKKYINNYTRFFGWNILKKESLLPLPSKYPMIVDYITGADLLVRKSIIEELGLFNPVFFMYYEETEMQFRYKKHNYLTALISEPNITHLEGGSKKKSLKSWRIELEASFIYAKLCFAFPKYVFIRMLALFLLTPKILIYSGSISEKIKSIYSLITPIKTQ